VLGQGPFPRVATFKIPPNSLLLITINILTSLYLDGKTEAPRGAIVAKSVDTEPVPEWVEEDPEIELTMEMDDEELEFDEFAEDSAVKEVAVSREDVPLWRLIEMSREDRSLKMELADFDDYDDYDSDYSGGFPH
jgi:hypothetical protein